jgi:hypothetical protein
VSTLEEKATIHLLTGLHGQLVSRLFIIIMRKNAPVVDVCFCCPMGVPIRTCRPYSGNGNRMKIPTVTAINVATVGLKLQAEMYSLCRSGNTVIKMVLGIL